MLKGEELAAAIRRAIELKAQKTPPERVGPTSLAKVLGMTQPSASELIQKGRLAKDKYMRLVDHFQDVVGPPSAGFFTPGQRCYKKHR